MTDHEPVAVSDSQTAIGVSPRFVRDLIRSGLINCYVDGQLRWMLDYETVELLKLAAKVYNDPRLNMTLKNCVKLAKRGMLNSLGDS